MTDNMITKQIEDYIHFKQGLGFQLKIESEELRRFAAFTRHNNYKGHLTTNIVCRWITEDTIDSQPYRARRLGIIILFAQYIAVFDSNAQIPPRGIYGRYGARGQPHIYTAQEFVILIREAKRIYSPDRLRCTSIPVALSLLLVTGLRPNELCRLTDEDVDLANGLIYVRESKFKKSRIIPVQSSAVEALTDYVAERDQIRTAYDSNSFFLTTGARPLDLRAFEYAFQIVRKALLPQGTSWDGKAPRLYDFRHTFACQTILRWYREGKAINTWMVFLSTYLGHEKIADTYWYLSSTPELMIFASKRFEACFSTGEVGSFE